MKGCFVVFKLCYAVTDRDVVVRLDLSCTQDARNML